MRISDWSSDVCSSDLQEPGLGFTGPGSSRSACCNRQDEQCQPRLHSVPPRLHVHCASILHATPRDDLPLLVAQLPDVRAKPLCIEWLLVHRAAPPVCRSDDTDVTIGMGGARSEEHTSEIQSLMRSSY